MFFLNRQVQYHGNNGAAGNIVNWNVAITTENPIYSQPAWHNVIVVRPINIIYQKREGLRASNMPHHAMRGFHTSSARPYHSPNAMKLRQSLLAECTRSCHFYPRATLDLHSAVFAVVQCLSVMHVGPQPTSTYSVNMNFVCSKSRSCFDS